MLIALRSLELPPFSFCFEKEKKAFWPCTLGLVDMFAQKIIHAMELLGSGFGFQGFLLFSMERSSSDGQWFDSFEKALVYLRRA
jgi:hypothetical protein